MTDQWLKDRVVLGVRELWMKRAGVRERVIGATGGLEELVQRAAELLLLAHPFGAEKALAAGFVTEIIPEDELFEYASGAAAALAALPPASVQSTKRLMKRCREAAVAEAMAEEGRLFRERLAGAEAKEAMTAFFEKRKPDFSRF